MARNVLFHQTGNAEVLQIVELPTPEPTVSRKTREEYGPEARAHISNMVGHLHIGLIIAATAFLANAIAGNGSVTSAFLRGITVSCETNSLDRAVPRMDASFAEIRMLGANAIAIHPSAKMRDGPPRLDSRSTENQTLRSRRCLRRGNL